MKKWKPERKAGAFWAVSSVGGTFRAASSIDGSFYTVCSIDGGFYTVWELTVVFIRYQIWRQFLYGMRVDGKFLAVDSKSSFDGTFTAVTQHDGKFLAVDGFPFFDGNSLAVDGNSKFWR